MCLFGRMEQKNSKTGFVRKIRRVQHSAPVCLYNGSVVSAASSSGGTGVSASGASGGAARGRKSSVERVGSRYFFPVDVYSCVSVRVGVCALASSSSFSGRKGESEVG